MPKLSLSEQQQLAEMPVSEVVSNLQKFKEKLLGVLTKMSKSSQSLTAENMSIANSFARTTDKFRSVLEARDAQHESLPEVGEIMDQLAILREKLRDKLATKSPSKPKKKAVKKKPAKKVLKKAARKLVKKAVKKKEPKKPIVKQEKPTVPKVVTVEEKPAKPVAPSHTSIVKDQFRMLGFPDSLIGTLVSGGFGSVDELRQVAIECNQEPDNTDSRIHKVLRRNRSIQEPNMIAKFVVDELTKEK